MAIHSSTGEAEITADNLGHENARAAFDPADCVISFDGVNKSYIRNASRSLLRHRVTSWILRAPVERFSALRDVSFQLHSGESLAVVGLNGAGKSTLLRLATGISAPDSGRVKVRGTMAALMELGAGFHPDLTGAENLVLNASLLGLSRTKTYQEFDSIVEFSGIKEFIDEPLRTYSSGMILRLAFSVAVRVNPDILFIDEVLSVGDQGFQRKCVDEIKRFKGEGKTLVCVSHATTILRELCDRALWLEHGEVKMWGSMNTVLDHYEGRTKQ